MFKGLVTSLFSGKGGQIRVPSEWLQLIHTLFRGRYSSGILQCNNTTMATLFTNQRKGPIEVCLHLLGYIFFNSDLAEPTANNKVSENTARLQTLELEQGYLFWPRGRNTTLSPYPMHSWKQQPTPLSNKNNQTWASSTFQLQHTPTCQAIIKKKLIISLLSKLVLWSQLRRNRLSSDSLQPVAPFFFLPDSC